MSDFTLLYPMWLWALLPTYALLYWLSKRQKSHTLIAPHIAAALGVSSSQPTHRLLPPLGAMLTLAIVALSGPSFSQAERPAFSSTEARVIVMDMSMSMYANDIKPNRLSQARYKVSDLLAEWQEGDTALIAYAGDAYVVSPLTSDSQTILNLLPNLSPDIMPYPGARADIGIELAIELMKNAGLDRGHILLVSDDLDDDEQARSAELIDSGAWSLSVLAIGTESGAPIPLQDGQLLTHNGQTVVAKSNFDNMRRLASTSRGIFVPVQVTNEDINLIHRVMNQTDQATRAVSHQSVSDQVNHGYWLLPLIVLLSLLLFRRGVLLSALLVPLLWLSPSQEVAANPFKPQDLQAYEDYLSGDYSAAAEKFNDAQWQGLAHYQAGDFDAAIENLSGAKTANQHYNLANALAQSGQYTAAIEHYEQALALNPELSSASHNKAIVEQALQQQQQQGESGEQSEQVASQPNSHSGKNSEGNTGAQPEPQDEAPRPNNEPQQSQERNPSQPPASEVPSTSENSSSSEQSSTSEQSTTSEQNSMSEQERGSQEANDQTEQPNTPLTPGDATTNEIDPALRKLEQVEAARDPSRLLRAQLLLQAQQKSPPASTGKTW